MLTFVCAFLTALPFLDPPATVLLLVTPRLGVMLSAASITSEMGLDVQVGATRKFQLNAYIASVCSSCFSCSRKFDSPDCSDSLQVYLGGSLRVGFLPAAKGRCVGSLSAHNAGSPPHGYHLRVSRRRASPEAYRRLR
jgi:hypothetical protein